MRKLHALTLAAALAALLAVPLMPPPVWAQSADGAPSLAGQSAGTPAEQRLHEMAEALSTNDPGRIRAFVEAAFAPRLRNAFPMDRHLEILGELAARTGGFDIVSIEMQAPQVLTAVVRPRSGEPPLAIRLEVEPEPPHAIAGIGVRPADEPGSRPEPAASPEEAARRLKGFVDELAAADRFSGTVLVAHGDQVLMHEAWGEAEKAFHVANLADTKFNLGSMNKMFTAVAIARLVEEGRLSFDDRIGKYLGPEWLGPGIGDRVTIEHLLTHTSGLGSYLSPELIATNPGRYRSIDDYQEIVRRDSLRFAPGTAWSYSNTGFLLLGAIIEEVTGGSYYDAVRELVYEPAGMTATDAYFVDEPTPNLAVGYERIPGQDGGWRANYYGHVVRGGPAGGGYSTAPDLHAFARALREHRLLSPGMTRRVTSPKPEIGSPEYGYGFGFWDEGRVVGHTGGAPGINAALMIDMERGLTVVVLSNYGRALQPVLRQATALLGYASGS